ncbi:copper-binding protein [Allohahella marinimesophila]|uniref:Cu and Ag efflux protein CusF n=1 Tax=Allohahella marinimesophila TaxID=1054972 RepID=A0ABP7NHZ8_9GAMM
MQTIISYALAATLAIASTAAIADTVKDEGKHSGMSGGMSGEMHEGMNDDMHKNMDDMHKNMKGMQGQMGAKKGMKHDGGPMSSGVLRNIDTDARTLTIKHGPIKNLGMPPMSMVFQTDEGVNLDGLEAGEKIKFRVVDRQGKMTITEIQPDS